VRVAEAREHAARAGEAEELDELSSKDAERDGVEQQGALASEGQHAPLGFEPKELPQVEISGFHGRLLIDSRIDLSFR
jgi:hypothetical protein